LIKEGDIRIDLLLTDVVLPGINGRQLAEQAQTRRPGLKVLFTTGYSRNAIVHQGRLDAGVAMIQKPITQESLAARIRDRCHHRTVRRPLMSSQSRGKRARAGHRMRGERPGLCSLVSRPCRRLTSNSPGEALAISIART
jgi:DNA-binding NtrC family response regulator